jgi:hypothetical protein
LDIADCRCPDDVECPPTSHPMSAGTVRTVRRRRPPMSDVRCPMSSGLLLVALLLVACKVAFFFFFLSAERLAASGLRQRPAGAPGGQPGQLPAVRSTKYETRNTGHRSTLGRSSLVAPPPPPLAPGPRVHGPWCERTAMSFAQSPRGCSIKPVNACLSLQHFEN